MKSQSMGTTDSSDIIAVWDDFADLSFDPVLVNLYSIGYEWQAYSSYVQVLRKLLTEIRTHNSEQTPRR